MLVAVIVIIGIVGSYYGINLFKPVNADYLVFQAPHNVYLKAIKTPTEGYVFASQSVKGGKGIANSGQRNPVITVEKDHLITIHLINEDKTVPANLALHNINIDEFNVHSNDLKYFNTQSISFIADKSGTFEYYCSLHPEMRGKIIVKS